MKVGKLLLVLLILVWPATASSFTIVAPTDQWVDFWGKLTIKGQPCEAGDKVGVYDPQGVCCGASVVTPESAAGGSQYPFLHVYGDDPYTPDIDEGAEPGDVLTFRVYRASEDKFYSAAVLLDVMPGDPDPPQWVTPPAPLTAWEVDVRAEDPGVVDSWDLEPGGEPYDLMVEGTGTLLDGFRIHIPAGALPNALHLTIRLSDKSQLPALPKGAFGFPFHLEPDGVVFNAPVTITAPYGPDDPAGIQIAVWRWGVGDADWSTNYVTDPGIDTAANTVDFDTTRTGHFVPAATNPLKPEADSGGDSGGGGGCFIATAAFGSPLERHVADLKSFRDRFLLRCAPGKLFVAAYYRFSPAAARFISSHDTLRGPVRCILYPLAAASAMATASLPVQLGLLGLVLAGSGVLAVARRRAR